MSRVPPDNSIGASPSNPINSLSPVVHVFPVAIGHYTDPNVADLDVDSQVGRLLDLLAPFGARHHRWAAPAMERGADATQRRLLAWSRHDVHSPGNNDPDGPTDTALYWVGHGWSDGANVALAHAHSPARIGANGITPEQFADYLRARQARSIGPDGDQGWALVVVDTCQSRRFVEVLVAASKHHDPPQRVLLIGVSGEGATSLGRFTDALRIALVTTFKANDRILLTDLAAQFPRLLHGCEIAPLGDIYDAALRPVLPPVASWMTAPLDTIHHLEDILDDLDPDERRHFLAKAQGAEHGELSWFFEGRDAERAHIVAWLRRASSGMLVITGRAGAGKSALLGNLVVHSLPDLSSALIRRGLMETLPANQSPPAHIFDAVVHVSGLTLPQITHRLAAAIGLAAPPSREDPNAGIASDLDWLSTQLAAHGGPITFLVDALDECTDPLETARSLLARIAAIPGVRIVVGTRASTNETPDAPADDRNLLEALAVSGATDVRPAGGGGNAGGVLWLTRDPHAIRRYVRRRLRDARDHGRAGVDVPALREVSDEDIDRSARLVSERDREFLFARLAVYELIEDATLLTARRWKSLNILLEGDHQDMFAKALDRLARIDDRYPILMRALSLARGRGLPEADGIWATIAAGIAPLSDSPTISYPPPANDPQDDRIGQEGRVVTDAQSQWTSAIPELLAQAAAYIIVDVSDDRNRFSVAASSDSSSTWSGTVYRLAHRTFVEYFTKRPDRAHEQDQSRAAVALLRAASAVAARDPAAITGYLAGQLSSHIADAGLWDSLVSEPFPA